MPPGILCVYAVLCRTKDNIHKIIFMVLDLVLDYSLSMIQQLLFAVCTYSGVAVSVYLVLNSTSSIQHFHAAAAGAVSDKQEQQEMCRVQNIPVACGYLVPQVLAVPTT